MAKEVWQCNFCGMLHQTKEQAALCHPRVSCCVEYTCHLCGRTYQGLQGLEERAAEIDAANCCEPLQHEYLLEHATTEEERAFHTKRLEEILKLAVAMEGKKDAK